MSRVGSILSRNKLHNVNVNVYLEKYYYKIHFPCEKAITKALGTVKPKYIELEH